MGEFRRRWNNYKSNDTKFQRFKPCMQEHLFSHFSIAGQDGFLNGVSITKTDPFDPFQRKDYWGQTLADLILKTVSDGFFCFYFLTW